MSDENKEQPLNVSSLTTSLKPPMELEDRVISELRKRNLVAPRDQRSAWLRRAIVAAACVMFFIAGSLYEKTALPQKAVGVSMSDSTYVFFLLVGPSYQAPSNPQQRMERVESYRNWAIGLRHKGIPVTGTKLRNEKNILGTIPHIAAAEDEITGYFLIDAQSPEEALNIARAHPHLKYGGGIQVRRVDPV